ncbi:hypothetical protein O6027_12510 [Sphingomonas aerolata]|uniref:hypothetical protein n=1 Tax=Sphingomonas aerolata TaxID=185951 RepID=UPI003354FC71
MGKGRARRMGRTDTGRAGAIGMAGAPSTAVEAFTFGDPEPVNSRREVLDLPQCWHNGRWYEPPISVEGLARSFRASPHHSSATLDAWAHQPNSQTLLRDARKAAARRFAEAGCSNQEIKAWTGHTTDSEVARYTAAADQRTLSDTAADKFLANLAERLAKDAAKALKSGENK